MWKEQREMLSISIRTKNISVVYNDKKRHQL